MNKNNNDNYTTTTMTTTTTTKRDLEIFGAIQKEDFVDDVQVVS